jgi:hypothetical protein
MLLQTVLCYSYDNFYNIIFKIKHELYTASGSSLPPPPQQMKNFECTPEETYLQLPSTNTKDKTK